MIDFMVISTRSTKRGVIEIYPKFIIKKSTDLMIRGGDFYAIWIEERGLWSTDEQDALQLIDRELDRYAEENRQRFNSDIKVLHMWDAESGMIDSWHKYCQKQMRDSFHTLDDKLIFSNTETNKKDYASKKLNYPLEAGDLSAYEKLMSTLYSEEERTKIEWAIGSIVSGESKKLQKFMVLYGAAGTGKSTVLNIIQQLFDGYYSVFDAKALGSSSNSFALEAFKTNPLVAIQHDGDLSRIEDNTRLNSLVSHELMTVNEKFKSTYSNRFKCFLFMGTNKPVKITDAKSGLIRRLIDVSPSGNKLNPKEYKTIVKQVEFELGAIAYHCQEVYSNNPGRYDDYIPIAFEMMGEALEKCKFLKVMEALWTAVKVIAGGIADAVGTMMGTLAEKLGNADFSGVLDVLNSIAVGGIALSISKFLKSVTEPLEGLSDILEGVTGILDGVRGCFEAYQTNLKAGTLLKIGAAIALLAGSIVAISLIDSDKLSVSLGAITVLFANLLGAMAIFNKISSDTGKVSKACTAMIAMSVAVSILAGALKKVSDLDWGELARGLVGIAGLTTIVVASSKAMASGQKQVMKGATSLIIFGAAIKILASACRDLSKLQWDELGRGLTGVGVLFAEIAVFLRVAKFNGKMLSTATGIVILAAAMKVLASACKDFGQMEWSEIGKGLAGIGGLLAELAVFTNLAGNAKHVMSTGVALIAIGAAMKIFASAVKDFGQLQWDEIGRGLTAMGGALAEVAIAVNLMPKNMIGIGTGLVIVGGALEIIANCMSKFGDMQWEEIGRGLTVMGGALAELAISLNFMKGTLGGSAALLVASGALAVLAPVLSILGALSWEAIAKGLISIAGAFTIIGVAGAVLTPLVPTILALSGAFALIGVGVLTIGAGLLAAGTGLSALAIGFTALATAGAAGATAIVAALTVIVTGIAGVVAFFTGNNDVGTFGEKLVPFGEAMKAYSEAIMGMDSAAITNSATAGKALVELANTIPNTGGLVSWFTGDNDLGSFGDSLVQFGSGIKSYSDSISGIDTGIMSSVITQVNRLVEMAKGMAELDTSGMSGFSTALIQLGNNGIDGFINAFTDASGRVTSAATSMLTTFINAANAQKGNLTSTFTTMMQAVLTTLTNYQTQFNTAGSTLMTKFISGIKSQDGNTKTAITNIISGCITAINNKQTQFNTAGANLMIKLIAGVKSKDYETRNAFVNILSSCLTAIANKYPEFQNAGMQCMIKFIAGVKEKAEEVKTAFTGNLNASVTAIRDYHDQFKQAGTYLVEGFADGISENTYRAEAKARAMARAAAEAAEDELDEHSPSRVGYHIGDFFGLGFVNAIGTYAVKAYNASAEMADSAKTGLGNAIAKVKDMIDNGVDGQPTIRPILDLSDVEEKSHRLNTLFSRSQALTVSTGIAAARGRNLQNEDTNPNTGNSYNFTQNNYSPKALSRTEIYRQTKNQFSAMERMVET